MSYIDLFPTTLFQKDLDFSFEKIENIKEQLLNKELYLTQPGTQYHISENQKLLENSLFQDLKNQIITYSKTYLESLGHIFEDLQIATSWCHISPPNSVSAPTHTHANSYISGVFYITEGSPIVFYNPLFSLWKMVASREIKNKSFRASNEFYINPIPGKLLLFPSFLGHSVSNNNSDKERISIAFNIIPKGEFGTISSKIYL